MENAGTKMKSRLQVTRCFLPPKEELFSLLSECWENAQLTNNGPLLTRLEASLNTYLGVGHSICLTNGTVALEEALAALGLADCEIITTPFSFVATLDAILLKNCTPVFADIDAETLCIDPKKIEEKITPRTRAILAVHVFGNLCDVEAIERIARKHELFVIYDAAHSFASFKDGASVFRYGDISTCSFHATKVFHTAEGGACFTSSDALAQKLKNQRSFGLVDGMPESVGTNAKMSEIHAAIGLCNLKYLDSIIEKRKQVTQLYDSRLAHLQKPVYQFEEVKNYAYYPVIFKSEKQLLAVVVTLNKEEIYPRRYFYPSLNMVPFVEKKQSCPVSEDISRRILCLPLSAETTKEQVMEVADIVSRIVNEGV
jgi:dTDP-4-amino-4,6-dideoxygalactose transaminase